MWQLSLSLSLPHKNKREINEKDKRVCGSFGQAFQPLVFVPGGRAEYGTYCVGVGEVPSISKPATEMVVSAPSRDVVDH